MWRSNVTMPHVAIKTLEHHRFCSQFLCQQILVRLRSSKPCQPPKADRCRELTDLDSTTHVVISAVATPRGPGTKPCEPDEWLSIYYTNNCFQGTLRSLKSGISRLWMREGNSTVGQIGSTRPRQPPEIYKAPGT